MGGSSSKSTQKTEPDPQSRALQEFGLQWVLARLFQGESNQPQMFGGYRKEGPREMVQLDTSALKKQWPGLQLPNQSPNKGGLLNQNQNVNRRLLAFGNKRNVPNEGNVPGERMRA